MKSTTLDKSFPGLESGLLRLGYVRLPLSKGCILLCTKQLNNVYLSLGVERSRYRKNEWTGSFYLAPTLSWSYAPPGEFPEKAYRRIGECLSTSERKKFFPLIASKEIDVWWNEKNEHSVDSFLQAVEMAEKQFTKSKDLQERVIKSKSMRELLKQLIFVQNIIKVGRFKTNLILSKVKRNELIKDYWYQAAAQAAQDRFEEYYHKDGVQMLAEEAWLMDWIQQKK
jgi:hypothetical protein